MGREDSQWCLERAQEALKVRRHEPRYLEQRAALHRALVPFHRRDGGTVLRETCAMQPESCVVGDNDDGTVRVPILWMFLGPRFLKRTDGEESLYSRFLAGFLLDTFGPRSCLLITLDIFRL